MSGNGRHTGSVSGGTTQTQGDSGDR